MNFIKRNWGWMLLVLAAGMFLICYFGSAYWAVYSIKEAVADRNQEVINSYIDFGSLRTNLKNQLTNQVEMKFAEKTQKPLNKVLQALSYTVVDNLVDQYVTPQGVSELFSGVNKIKGTKKQLEQGNQAKQSNPIQETVSKEQQVQNSEQKVEWSLNYGDNPNQFFAVITPLQKQKDKIVVSMIREGFFGWKVNNILLPLNF